MTSTVRIVFKEYKDFKVSIDNINKVSPRGLELAFAKVEKRFAELKGQAVADRKKAERAAEVDKAQDEASVVAMEGLVQEEHSKTLPEAVKRAQERLKSEDVEPSEKGKKGKK